jgi:hypothetical protein
MNTPVLRSWPQLLYDYSIALDYKYDLLSVKERKFAAFKEFRWKVDPTLSVHMPLTLDGFDINPCGGEDPFLSGTSLPTLPLRLHATHLVSLLAQGSLII